MRVRRVALVGLLVAAGVSGWALRPWRGPMRAPTIRVTSAYREFTDTLGQRETLSDVLARAGVTGRRYAAFLAAARRLDARRLRPGLVLHFRQPLTDSVIDRLSLRVGPERRLWYARDSAGGSWSEREEHIAWVPERLRIQGTITTSLYQALDASLPDSVLPGPERQTLAWAIADVYDWEVDFTRDVRPGDQFEVLFERLLSREGGGGGERRFGRVVASRVEVAHTPSYAFFFVTDSLQERGGFFDDHGRSLKRAFLRAPLQFRRISSRFGGRVHPILRSYRAHHGVDYSAAYGTPVRATADGQVSRAGRVGGMGNMIEVRHVNGIHTRYGHLAGFAKGLHVGSRVRQGETIGFVGSTGLSTGPHLHYEFVINGRPTNPQRSTAGTGAPIPRSLQAAFEATRSALALELEPPRAVSGTVKVD